MFGNLDLITSERIISHIKLIETFLKQTTTSSIIVADLGCGKGIYFRYYVRRGFFVIGIDIDKKTLYRVKSQYKDVSLIIADAQNIPLRESSVNMIVIAELLEHLNSPESCLKECHRILKEKGAILISVPWLFEIYRPLSTIILRTLFTYKRTGNPPLLLRILFTINEDKIKRRKIFGLFIENLWKFARNRDRSFNRLSFNSPKSPEEYILMYKKGSLFNDQHKVFMTPKEWTDMVKAIGFDVLRIDGAFPYPPLLWRIKNIRCLLRRISKIVPSSFRAWFSQTLIIFGRKRK